MKIRNKYIKEVCLGINLVVGFMAGLFVLLISGTLMLLLYLLDIAITKYNDESIRREAKKVVTSSPSDKCIEHQSN